MIWFGACQILHKSFIKHIQSFNLLFRLSNLASPTGPSGAEEATPGIDQQGQDRADGAGDLQREGDHKVV